MENKILSLLLPTYNRSRCIGEQLRRLSLVDKAVLEKVEIIVSDNCSPDNTQQVVESYIDKLSFTYFRNKENLGSDGNFLQCLSNAHGKYAWLLGDDDYLEYQNLCHLIEELEKGDYGLVHINVCNGHDKPARTFDNAEDFLEDIGVFITFMSSNIINMKYFQLIDLNKYMGSFFLQVPLYINSAIHSSQNRMLYLKMFGSDGGNQNGGYNLFQVFTVNYLKIYSDFIDAGLIDKSFYEKQVKVSENFLLPYMYDAFILNKKGGWTYDGAWDIINKYYGCWHIRWRLGKTFVRRFLGALYRKVFK